MLKPHKATLPSDWFGKDSAGLFATVIVNWAAYHQGSYTCAEDIALLTGLTYEEFEQGFVRIQEALGSPFPDKAVRH